ncbi:MAG: hypothetical protein KC800_08930 [Candidatus Eremiobacteraeota bacterium]|nr:hypothetical protein [Candidatus Eremiobacteraeota bacterium]
MTDSKVVREELRGSLEFVMGVLVFGAAIFSVLFNLIYLAVDNDLRLKEAYLVIAHHKQFTSEEVNAALHTLDDRLREDVREEGRPVLCDDDEALIELYETLEGEQKALAQELLARKTGLESGWDKFLIQKLPTSRAPYRMPFLELNLMYYGWIIEIATLIFLSQSLRKPHVQAVLFRQVLKPYIFLPLATLLLYIPAWHWATLVYPRTAGWPGSIISGLGCLLLALLMFKVAKVQLTESKMNELGFHLLISSLFVQLLTAMGDPDVVYQVFSAPRMETLRYISWFIILCYPGLLLEKWYRGMRPKEPVEE